MASSPLVIHRDAGIGSNPQVRRALSGHAVLKEGVPRGQVSRSQRIVRRLIAALAELASVGYSTQNSLPSGSAITTSRGPSCWTLAPRPINR